MNRRATGTRVELWGRVVDRAELRVTPTGQAVLRFSVDCGSEREALTLAVVMTGARCRELAAELVKGRACQVTGRLRQTASAARAALLQHRLEVVAESVEV